MAERKAIHITYISRDQLAVTKLKSKLSNHKGYQFSFDTSEISTVDHLKYNVLVSPSNGFGELLGGVDMQFYMLLGRDVLQNYIYSVIKKRYAGEVLVGQSCLINLKRTFPQSPADYLLLCPTMAIPLDISGTRNAYYATKAMIDGLRTMQAAGISCNTVLCPIPCIGVGNMAPSIASLQIETAFAAYENKGLIAAVHMDGNDTDLFNTYSEYQPNSVAKNSKIAHTQMLKGR
jgi:hypothetical protein